MANEYFVFACQSPLDADHYSYVLDDEKYPQNFHAGRRFGSPDDVRRVEYQHPASPIKLSVNYDPEDTYPRVWPEFVEYPIPIMTKVLFKILRRAGVNNIQPYEIIIYDPETETENTDYIAWNLCGTVAAADLQKTEYDQAVPERIVAMDINSLVIDEKKAKGHLMFRLAESTNAILIHSSVKERLEAVGFDTLTFIPPDLWAG